MKDTTDEGKITRLISMEELLEELRLKEVVIKKGDSEKKTRRIIIPRGNKIYGGNGKMREKRSRLGTAVIFSLGALAGGYFTNWRADKKIEAMHGRMDVLVAEFDDYKDNIHLEMARRKKLNDELDDQIKEANGFLIRTTHSEGKFEKFVKAASGYMGKSTPSGELEESAAKGVETLKGFFSSYEKKKIRLTEMVDACYASSTEIKEKRESPFSQYKETVEGMNSDYTTVFAALSQKLHEEVKCLDEFMNHTDRYPLRGRQTMKERTNEEIKKRKDALKEASEYIDVFEANSQTDGILPVRIRGEKASQENVAVPGYQKPSL